MIATGRMRKFFKYIGADRAIIYTLINRGWSLISGLLVVKFLVVYLDVVEQGYYFTFMSILGIQVLFELGFGFVVMQTTSHYRSGIVFYKNGKFDGDIVSKEKLSSLLILTSKWYCVTALLFIISLLPIGIVFLKYQKHNSQISWLYPWILAVPAFGVTIVINAAFNMIEGCGFIIEAAKIRLLQSFASITCLCASLYIGLGLFSIAIMYIAGFVASLGLIMYTKQGLYFSTLLNYNKAVHISWRKEIWPFQWRIALSWMSGYFASQIFTLLLFHLKGPVLAGQMGMSISIVGAACSGISAWITTKSSLFGKLAAENNIPHLDALFFGSLRQTLILSISTAALLIGGIYMLNYTKNIFAIRFLEPFSFSMLVIASVINVFVSSFALYLRSFRKEPFLVISVCNAIFLTVYSLLVVKSHGAVGLMTGNLLASLLIGLIWGGYVFNKNRRKLIAIDP